MARIQIVLLALAAECLLILLAALVRPGWAMPWSRAPRRWKTTLIYAALTVAFVVAAVAFRKSTLDVALEDPDGTTRLSIFDSTDARPDRRIGKLRHLQSLDLRHGKLRALAPEVATLRELREVNFEHNDLHDFPVELLQLPELTGIVLSHNKLVSVPSLSKLSKLEHLGLGNNDLLLLPADLGSLQALNYLRLDGNRLSALPDVLPPNLIMIDVSDNRLVRVPPPIYRLARLNRLFLAGNQITRLEDQIGQLTQLELLDLDRNPLRARAGATTTADVLPTTLATLEHLNHLSLAGCDLTEVPPLVRKLKQLRYLTLANNPIREIPAWLAELPLERLDLQNTRVASLPHVLATRCPLDAECLRVEGTPFGEHAQWTTANSEASPTPVPPSDGGNSDGSVGAVTP